MPGANALRNKNDQGSTHRRRRSFTIELTLSGVLTVLIMLFIGMGWVFAFGVIVGRGDNPETEMTNLLPKDDVEQPQTPPEEILPKESLTFMNDLKRVPPTPSNNTEPKNTTAVKEPLSPPKTATKPIQQPKTTQSNTVSSAQATPQTVESNKIFNYVLQVVAYKNSEQTDALREELENKNLRTRMTLERDETGAVKWYRVQVLLRGNDTNLTQAQEILRSMGIRDAMVIVKEPLPPAQL